MESHGIPTKPQEWPVETRIDWSVPATSRWSMQRISALESTAMPPPIGPEVDTTPRPLPARVPIRGAYAVLEPLHSRHAPDLWQAAQGAEESWTYLGYGPFATAEAMARFVGEFAATHDPMVWAVR